ncbi:MAG: glycosyltransferase family 39 protein [Candidatus Aenigmarchaeota archaeon]|nr:glycosyltransferase family 39 protein [Candidatus Aenigmarchaeota archaeon]
MDNEKKILLLLFVIPLLLVLFYLNEGLFHYDAIVLAQAVEKTYETSKLQPAINGRYGTVIIASILYFPFWLLGQNADLAVRLTSAVFYALSIPAAYLFIRMLFSSQSIGIYAAGLFAASPVYLSPNTFGKEHGMALFFVFTAFYLLLRGLQRNEAKALMASTVLLVISHTVREATLYFLPFYFFLAFFIKSKFKANTRLKYLLFPYVAGFMLLYFAYFDFIIQKTFFPEQIGTAYFIPRIELRQLAYQAVWQTNPVVLLFFAVAGIVIGIMQNQLPSLFMLVLLLGSFLFFANISTFAARYLDVFIFGLCTFSAVAISKIRWKIVGSLLCGYLIISSLLLIVPILSARHEYNGQKKVGLWIANNTPGDSIIITQDDAPFVTYYGKRTVVGPPIGSLAGSIGFAERMKEKIQNNTSVYLTISGLFEDPDDINKNLLPRYLGFESNYTLLSEDFHNAEIKMQRYYQIIWKLGLNATQKSVILPEEIRQ